MVNFGISIQFVSILTCHYLLLDKLISHILRFGTTFRMLGHSLISNYATLLKIGLSK